MNSGHFTRVSVLFVLLAAAALGQTVSVQVETKSVGLSSAGYLAITCHSDIPISGLVIPIKIGSNTNMIIDSVSFQYTIATGNFRRQSQITDLNRVGFINIIPDITFPIPTFPAGWGEICRIHFHTTKFASDVYVPVDTFYHPTLYEYLNASDAFGTTIYPTFTAGGVWIRQATAAEDTDAGIPKRFALGQNFPNPFNPSTQIVFSLAQSDDIRLDIYDIAGHHLTTLAEGRYAAGEHAVIWDAGSQPSGVYFYRLTSGSGVLARKMLLIK